MKTEYAFHPLADIFPLIDEGFLELCEDIKANGLADPIVIHEGKILDGRNRYRAILSAKLKPLPHHFVRFTGPDPVAFVISKNIHRRHLTAGQKAWAAAQFEAFEHGGKREKASKTEENQDANLRLARMELAEKFGVSERSINDAAKVRDRGVKELKEALKGGHVAVDVAAGIAILPAKRQHEIVDDESKDIAKTARTEIKKEKRENREKVLGAMQSALPQRKYGVIVADPEWRFEPWSRDSGMDRAADNHYPTSCTEVIAARPVADIAADDCILFLWATVPMLPDALKVMSAWGFEYKSHCIWHKDRVGTGYWFRNAHELLLVGTRGNIPAPAMGEQCESVIDAEVSTHSTKPEKFYELIERYFPNLPKIELNARRARDGWDAWGFEAPENPTRAENAQVGIEPRPQATEDRDTILDQYHAQEIASPISGPCCDDIAKAQLAEVDSDSKDDDGGIPEFLRRPANPQAEAG